MMIRHPHMKILSHLGSTVPQVTQNIRGKMTFITVALRDADIGSESARSPALVTGGSGVRRQRRQVALAAPQQRVQAVQLPLAAVQLVQPAART